MSAKAKVSELLETYKTLSKEYSKFPSKVRCDTIMLQLVEISKEMATLCDKHGIENPLPKVKKQ